MNVLSNSFSLNMLDIKDFSLLQVKRVMGSEVPKDVVSAVGHQDTARVLGKLLGFEVECKRTTIKLEMGDVLYVGQYSGPRLPEGATELPEGAQIDFYRIIVRPEGCKGCPAIDCNSCGFMDLFHGA